MPASPSSPPNFGRPDVLRPTPWCVTHNLGADGVPVADVTFISLDFETSGLASAAAHIIEVSARKFTVLAGQVSHFETLVQSPTGVGPTHVHHIVADDLVGAPTQFQVAQVLKEILRDGVVLAHNAEFEQGFLAALFQQTGVWPEGVVHFCDTLAAARQYVSGLSNHRLATVHQRVLGRPIVGAHTAAGDTLAVLDLWHAMCTQLPGLAIATDAVPERSGAWSDEVAVKPRH